MTKLGSRAHCGVWMSPALVCTQCAEIDYTMGTKSDKDDMPGAPMPYPRDTPLGHAYRQGIEVGKGFGYKAAIKGASWSEISMASIDRDAVGQCPMQKDFCANLRCTEHHFDIVGNAKRMGREAANKPTESSLVEIDLDEVRRGNNNIVVSKAYGRPGEVKLHDLCDEIERLRASNDALKRLAEALAEKEGRFGAARPDEDGSFDELFFDDLTSVHFEMMDDNALWIGLYRGDRSYHVNIVARGKLKVNHYDA